jgi:hypothetical protein
LQIGKPRALTGLNFWSVCSFRARTRHDRDGLRREGRLSCQASGLINCLVQAGMLLRAS